MGTLRKATSLQVSHVLLLSLHQRTRALTETTKTTTRREKRFGTSSSRIMYTQGLAVTRFDSSIPDLSTTETCLQEIPHHLSQNDDKQQQHRQQAPPFLNWSDIRMVVLHLLSCVVVSLSFCAWEDYTVSFVPHDTAVPRRPHAILGMAYGQEGLKVMSWISDDQKLLTTDDLMMDPSLSVASPSPETTTVSTWPPRPYNDIMLEHRSEHVPRWTSTVTSEATVREATRNVYQALQAVDTMGKLADDYEWDQMRALLHAPVLRQTLEEACNALRTATTFLPPEARREIGFHWGRYIHTVACHAAAANW